MKSKYLLIVLLLIIVGVGLWWFMQPTVATPEKIAQVRMPAKTDATKQVTPPAQVELPKAPAVPASSSTFPANPLPDPNDPQADLKTAFPDIVNWMRIGDMLTIKKNYIPPNKLTPEQFERELEATAREMSWEAQNPDPYIRAEAKSNYEESAKEFESLENQIPTYNSTGDEATYTFVITALHGGDDSPATKTFVKINGKWYLKEFGDYY